MSSYFERLMVASGVRIGPAATAEGQGTLTTRGTLSTPPAASGFDSGLEVSDAETPVPPAVRPQATPRATAPRDESPRSPVADNLTPAPPPGSPERFSSSLDEPNPSGDVASVSREEVLGAVMSWISAGQAMPDSIRRTVTAPAPTSDADHDADPASAQRLSPADRSASDMTTREKSPPLPAGPPSIHEPAETRQPAAPNSVESDARPPSISIGAIHVRVEAPPPAVGPARPTPPAERTPVLATLSASALKLRRYYVLPH